MQSCWRLFGVSLIVCLMISAPGRCQGPGISPDKSVKKSSVEILKARDPSVAAEATKQDPSTGAASERRTPASTLPSAIQTSSRSGSLFDAASSNFAPVVSNVQVRDLAEPDTTEPFYAGGQEIVAAAGSFGDVSKFFQAMPGVAALSDATDDLLVRGGDPMENLFLIDGIQVPNINSLATLGTTGGFGPMIDSAAIQSVNLKTGGYGAEYPERLSSVFEIRTLEARELTSHAEADLGIQGIGGLVDTPLRGSDLLLSTHHGLLNVLNSFGIEGLPSYTNELMRLRRRDGRGDRLTLLHLGGWDSLKITPCPNDPAESSTIDSQYSGLRETTGVEWQHVYSKDSFGVANVSDSEQMDHTAQQDQLPDPVGGSLDANSCALTSISIPVPVYQEHANGAFTTVGYQFEWSRSWITVTAGSAFWLQRPHYRIDQPAGALSPYSASPVRTDSMSFSSRFSTGESGTYTEITAHPARGLVLSAGGRLQSFALGDHNTLTPRVIARYKPAEYLAFHAALATYAQRPPYVYLLSFPQNRSLLPMRAIHEVAGIDIGPVLSSQIRIEAYQKIYRDVPASTKYPAVNLHDQVDTLGAQRVWLPMDSQGFGHASGIEVSDTTRVGSRFLASGSVAYSRAMFASHDGVMRPANIDLPWIVNLSTLGRIGRGYELSSRFGYASGRPYTPFDLPDSLAQNRAVYDTARMNALRAPDYARLDVQIDKDILLHGVHMELYLGVNNILNRSNFLGEVWLPRAKLVSTLSPVYELDQMPIFPNFGLRYLFR